jgi:hypothetical protein
MVATRKFQSGRDGPPAIVARPWLCETGHCRTPREFSDRRTSQPERLGMRETQPQTWCPPRCKSVSRSCSLPRRIRPSSRFGQVRGLRADGLPEPTFASTPGVGGSPFRLEKSMQNRRPRGWLFFERAQLPAGLLKRRLVALSLHRVLGTLERKTFLLHDPSELIVAEADPRFLDQVGVQASQRPNTEAVSQVLRRRLDRCPQGGTILRRCPRRPPRRLPWNQTVRTTLPVTLPRDVDCADATSQIVGNRRLRAAGRAHENDRCIAKHHSVRRAETQSVQGVPCLAGQAPSCHDRLRAINTESQKA